MNVYYNFDEAETSISAKTIVTVGAFDGVHRGHRRLIREMNEIADNKELIPLVITFWPHPKQVLKRDAKLLSTLEEKLFLLGEVGAQNVLVVNFTKEFSQISHSDFLNQYLITKLDAKAIVLSGDHHFGCGRQGSNKTIEENSIETIVLPRYENISSSAVRDAIAKGDMTTAHKLLDAPYLIIEPVVDTAKIVPEAIDCNNVRVIKL